MNFGTTNKRLEMLREWRRTPARDLSVAPIVQQVARDARRVERGLGAAMEAWRVIAPDALAECCHPVGLSGGTLEMACDSSAAAYELNSWMQSEGRSAFAKVGVPVLRMKMAGKKAEPRRTRR